MLKLMRLFIITLVILSGLGTGELIDKNSILPKNNLDNDNGAKCSALPFDLNTRMDTYVEDDKAFPVYAERLIQPNTVCINNDDILLQPQVDFKLQKFNIKYSPQDMVTQLILDNKQITNSDGDYYHPDMDIDSNGNPVFICYKETDLINEGLRVRASPDKGETWPEDLIWTINSDFVEEINGELSFLDNSNRAFGTFETIEGDPTPFLIIYDDFYDVDTWYVGAWDYTPWSTLQKETAITASGNDFVVIGWIQDIQNEYYDLDDTLWVRWSVDGGEIWHRGYYSPNLDNEGNIIPYAHLQGDSSRNWVIFCYEKHFPKGNVAIYADYCRLDQETDIGDWKKGYVVAKVTGGDCTHPEIAVSIDKAYIVYMNNMEGNEDIYCAVTTNGFSWKKHVIANSTDDELYPVASAKGENVTCLFVKNDDFYMTKSRDGGETWTTPIKVDDESGDIVAEYEYADVEMPYALWMDDRNGNYDLFFDSIATAPLLKIEDIAGGFGLTVTVSNNGNAPASNIHCAIEIDGLVIKNSEEYVISVQPDSTETLTMNVFGFGPVGITVTADTLEETASGFVLGPLVLGLK